MFPGGFTWGLPMADYPRLLGWFHDRLAGTPARRSDFPSWSWCGWQGTVIYPNRLIREPIQDNSEGDLILEMVAIEWKELIVMAWVVILDVQVDPFASVFIEDEMVGTLTGRNLFPHETTLVIGKHTCLVLERVKTKGRKKQTVFMLVLGSQGEGDEVAERRTMVTFTCDVDFSRLNPEQKLVALV
ncbi:hypothetical protein QBC43DRAFT_321839 [Cladorrhinum sp. PSN259]|nr:hypothetical protein QBC43DRAFT_321839 [Cladorrhinum sp. PSN259]